MHTASQHDIAQHSTAQHSTAQHSKSLIRAKVKLCGVTCVYAVYAVL